MLEYLKENGSDTQKILFTGLDTAGKTSIITTLKREFDKIALLSPTRGAQRRVFEFLGMGISEWDLGGQKSYRISYLKNPNKYFDNTEIAIYVIDIQDKERISEAVSYLKDVTKKFEELEIKPPIYIFFHKLDPILLENAYNEYNTLLITLKQKLRTELNYDEIYFYETSIYDLSTIFKAMSEILLTLYPKSELIEKTIKEFAKKINSEGVVVIDDNSLLIGSYYDNNKIREILTVSTPYFLTLNDSFRKAEDTKIKQRGHVIVERFNRFIIFTQITLREESPPYYLLLVKENPEYSKIDIESFSNLLTEILY
ncbi:MAG: ADP-ribosylation factor-like protein [Candidatus Lokiarchaeota archaeon]